MEKFNDIGEAIKFARIDKRVTQEELAEILNVTPTHVKHLESGHRKPSIPVLFAIAKTLNMSVDNIIFAEKTKNDKLMTDIINAAKQLNDSQLNVVLDLINSIIKNS